MGNLLYDFFPGAPSRRTSARARALLRRFLHPGLQPLQHAVRLPGILGLGYNATPALRIGLEGRYYGPPTRRLHQQHIMALLSVSYKFGQPEVDRAAAPPQR